MAEAARQAGTYHIYQQATRARAGAAKDGIERKMGKTCSEWRWNVMVNMDVDVDVDACGA